MITVLAVTAKFEKPVYMSDSIDAACEMAMSLNKSPYSVLYIVVKPNGERMSVVDQKQWLAA